MWGMSKDQFEGIFWIAGGYLLGNVVMWGLFACYLWWVGAL